MFTFGMNSLPHMGQQLPSGMTGFSQAAPGHLRSSETVLQRALKCPPNALFWKGLFVGYTSSHCPG